MNDTSYKDNTDRGHYPIDNYWSWYEKICSWTCIQDATQKDLFRETQKEMFLSI